MKDGLRANNNSGVAFVEVTMHEIFMVSIAFTNLKGKILVASAYMEVKSF